MSASPHWPTLHWEASTPEEQGLESRSIVQALRAIRTRIPRLHSLLIVRNGYSVAEVYFYPFGPGLAARRGVLHQGRHVLPGRSRHTTGLLEEHPAAHAGLFPRPANREP